VPKIGQIEVTPEQFVGFDTDRKWATGAQAFSTPDFTIMVFRDQLNLQSDDGSADQSLVKNVVSVAMPTAVALEFQRLLAAQFENLGLK